LRANWTVETQLVRPQAGSYESRARIVPDNRFAFPPLHKDVPGPGSTRMCESGQRWRGESNIRPGMPANSAAEPDMDCPPAD